MVNMQNYEKMVRVLNTPSLKYKGVATEDELVMIAALEARAMPPSVAKETVRDLIKEGYLEKRNNYIRFDNLYDNERKMYVMKDRKGNTVGHKPKRNRSYPRRTVRYVGPGHTVVGYEHRTLHIKFPETQKEFKAKQTARRRKAAKNRTVDDTILIDRDEHGNMQYVSKKGKRKDLTAKKKADNGKTVIIKRNLKKDAYTLEDMRALLRDDHWDEVCGNKRWNYDSAATVKEFNKYLKTKR